MQDKDNINIWTEGKSSPIEDIMNFKKLIKESAKCYPNAVLITEKHKEIIKDIYGVDLDIIETTNKPY